MPMTESREPPLLSGRPAYLRCCRMTAGVQCGNEPTWHVFWNAEGENGVQCNVHMEETMYRWEFYAAHPWDPICSMVGVARFHHEENRCSADLADLEVLDAPT